MMRMKTQIGERGCGVNGMSETPRTATIAFSAFRGRGELFHGSMAKPFTKSREWVSLDLIPALGDTTSRRRSFGNASVSPMGDDTGIDVVGGC